MRRGAGVRRGAVAVCALLLLVVASGLVAAPAARAESEVELRIGDPEITESSGLAADPNGGFYWTVNDSEDDARVFAVGPDGQTLGAVSFRADVTDVEALARTGDGLYVADIGDNGAERDSVTVYRLSQLTPGGTSVYSAWDLTYADGRARDAEAIAVTSGGDLLVITKEAEGGVWTTEEPLTAAGTNTLQQIGDAPPFVTDATVLADGRVVVRSYLSLSVLDPVSFEVQASAALPLQPQGESLTTSLDGESLLVGSEGEGSEVLRVPVPEVLTQDLPEDGAEPPAEASAEPSGGTSAEPAPGEGQADGEDADQEGAGSGGARRGTFLAVGLATLLALAAAAVVALVGRGGSEDAGGAADPAGGDPDPPADDPGPAGGDPDLASDGSRSEPVESAAGASGAREGSGAADSSVQDATTDPDGVPAAAPEAPGTAEEDTGTFVRSEERPGRVTWSEPEQGDAAAPEPGDQVSDVDWLYQDREDR